MIGYLKVVNILHKVMQSDGFENVFATFNNRAFKESEVINKPLGGTGD